MTQSQASGTAPVFSQRDIEFMERWEAGKDMEDIQGRFPVNPKTQKRPSFESLSQTADRLRKRGLPLKRVSMARRVQLNDARAMLAKIRGESVEDIEQQAAEQAEARANHPANRSK